MSTIGTLQETRGIDELEGQLSTLEISVTFRIVRQRQSTNPNAPTHTIVAWSKSGTEVTIGSAWLKPMKKLGREGEQFLSLTFSDPSFGKPLNVAAFSTDRPGEWTISFRHRQERVA